MDHIVYKWLEKPVQSEENLELPQFCLVNITRKDCSQNYTTGKVTGCYLLVLLSVSFFFCVCMSLSLLLAMDSLELSN